MLLVVAADVPLDAKLMAVAEQLTSIARLLNSCGLAIFAAKLARYQRYQGAALLCCTICANLGQCTLAAGASIHARDAAGITPLGSMLHAIGWRGLTPEERQALQALLAAGAALARSDSLYGRPMLGASRSQGTTELLLGT